jgi:hypothetical protein
MGRALTLHRVGHAPQPLGTFGVSYHPLWTTSGNPPVLWLDNERFLTQDGNGNLIAVALDRTRSPVVEVPAKQEVEGGLDLERDPDGRIVYTCGDDRFFIDVGAKTWERCEWASLGRGFDASWKPDWLGRYTIRYQGKEIGESHEWLVSPRRAASTDGRLAIRGDDPRVRVWSAGTGTWTELELRVDMLVGWLK